MHAKTIKKNMLSLDIKGPLDVKTQHIFMLVYMLVYTLFKW